MSETPRVWLGIDPGLGGGIAALIGDAVVLNDTPTAQVRKREYLPAEMAALLRPWTGPQAQAFAVIEAVSGRPGEGAASARSIGLGFGLWVGILAALEIPCEVVQPQVWKRHFSLVGADKNASRLRAQSLFPTAVEQLQRVKDHGRAESLLLALYARRRAGG